MYNSIYFNAQCPPSIHSMPFSVIGSTDIVGTPDGRQVPGRAYSWDVAEVENEQHCDFKKLRNLIIRSHMLDLISTTEETHYENYRQQQMASRKFGEAKQIKGENKRHREKEDLCCCHFILMFIYHLFVECFQLYVSSLKSLDWQWTLFLLRWVRAPSSSSK
ncbi:Septin-domain-containing protein [Circinella umbellata]|nr:Septin-domain-containing protein [Circinella umbellata]